MPKENTFSGQKFLNTLFHELRIPISSINGYASLFLSGELGKVSKPQLKVIRKIKELSLYASELVNNLLTLSRLDAPRIIHYDKICVADVIQRAITALNIQIHSRNLKVLTRFSKVKEPIWVFPLDIEQIVINILSNAVKFNSKNGRVYIAIKRESGKLYLSFKDTGIGIPKEALSRISEDFYRADNVVNQYEGCGLGLSIVKRLLKHNKGDIYIKSKLNEGTCVDIAMTLLTDKEVFDYELEQYISESSRLKIPFCLLMVADKTAAENGREDNLLRAVNEAMRKNDRAYQIDAGRAVAILPDSDYSDARLVFERLRSILQEQALVRTKKRKRLPNAAIAMSFAVFPRDGAAKKELIFHLEQEINKPASLISGIKE